MLSVVVAEKQYLVVYKDHIRFCHGRNGFVVGAQSLRAYLLASCSCASSAQRW